jgi:RNA polymerase sigma-70 factor (ECF subfamily)
MHANSAATDIRPAVSNAPAMPDWRELYDELGERVFRMLHRMMGDRSLAEDLTHDTFLRVHESRETFDGSGAIAAWVFRIAGNLARDEMRRGEMRVRRLLHFPRPGGEAGDPHLRLTLQSAIERLDPDQRAVVLLHDVDGYNHAEIAAMLDIREGTSRARLSRARERLRAALGAGLTYEDDHERPS